MMTTIRVGLGLLVALLAALPVGARFVPRIPVAPRPPMPRPAPVGPHFVPIPVGGHTNGPKNDADDAIVAVLIGIGILIVGVAVVVAINRRSRPARRTEAPLLDAQPAGPAGQGVAPLLSTREVTPKAEETERLLRDLARQDPLLDPDHLRDWVGTTFQLVTRCWEARDFSRLRGLVEPGLMAESEGVMRRMREAGETNRVENLTLEALDLVHVTHPGNIEGQEFTALITFRANVYFVDDATGERVRGSDARNWFQEFWTFRRHDNTWLVRAIEQSHEANWLKAENQVSGWAAQHA